MSHWIKSSRDGRIEKTVEDSFSKDTYLHWNTSSEYIAGEDLHSKYYTTPDKYVKLYLV
jgi:hypothetical protein